MCAIHLIPEIDETRRASTATTCMTCNEPIVIGETIQVTEGPLDDGSGQRYRYVAHIECYHDVQYDVDDDGCFTYEGAQEVT